MMRCVLAATSVFACAAAFAEPLRFEQAFADAPVSLHYTATYQARDGAHGVEAWVDQGTRVKRITDGKLETQAQRADAREAEYAMTVLDRERRIATRITRGSLFQLGNFTDWFELAHALRVPRGAYELARTTVPERVAPAVAPCDWYRLVQEGHASTICWIEAAGLPLVILSESGREVWRVTQFERGPVPATVFEVHDEGFVRNDANSDLERD